MTYALGSCIAVAVQIPWPEWRAASFHAPDSTLDQTKASQAPAMFADTGNPLLFKSCYQLGAEKRRMTVRWPAEPAF